MTDADARAQLDRLWARGTTFLGSRYALLGGAMSWVSERNLVAAISNAGGFGVIACGSMTPALLEAEIAATQALTQMPFGVNLITMHPQLDDLVQVCLKANVGHVVLAGGIPPGGAVRAVKDGGAKLIAFAPALVLAKRLVRSGADAIVIEGSEAGGHIGPVSLTVLAQEILPHLRDVPVFVAGGPPASSRTGIPGPAENSILLKMDRTSHTRRAALVLLAGALAVAAVLSLNEKSSTSDFLAQASSEWAKTVISQVVPFFHFQPSRSHRQGFLQMTT